MFSRIQDSKTHTLSGFNLSALPSTLHWLHNSFKTLYFEQWKRKRDTRILSGVCGIR